VKDTIRVSINEQFQATLSEVEYKLYVLEPRAPPSGSPCASTT
jgi:hypothetical protein